MSIFYLKHAELKLILYSEQVALVGTVVNWKTVQHFSSSWILYMLYVVISPAVVG